jgi:hypothetical protein
MANPSSNVASVGTPFAPRALVPVNVGRSIVNLYPVINPSMEPHEHTHAFHINKTALSSWTIDLRVQLNALGHQLNLTALVNGVIHDYARCHNLLPFWKGLNITHLDTYIHGPFEFASVHSRKTRFL